MKELMRWSVCSVGNSVGLKVNVSDRDKLFDRQGKIATLRFADGSRPDIQVNYDKESFWNDTCHEIISIELKHWLQTIGKFPWTKGSPPKVLVRHAEGSLFMIEGIEDC
jgi:hypothetical protein